MNPPTLTSILKLFVYRAERKVSEPTRQPPASNTGPPNQVTSNSVTELPPRKISNTTTPNLSNSVPRVPVSLDKVSNLSPRVPSPPPAVSSPAPQVPSTTNNAAVEMKIERGPIHQFSHKLKMTRSSSDPSITNNSANRPKTFNTKPRPFGKPATDLSPTVEPLPIYTQSATSSTNFVTSPLEDSNSKRMNNGIVVPNNKSQNGTSTVKPIVKQEEAIRTVDNGTYPKVYPSTPIMGKQQLNSNAGQSAVSSDRHGSPSLDNSQPRARYVDTTYSRLLDYIIFELIYR